MREGNTHQKCANEKGCYLLKKKSAICSSSNAKGKKRTTFCWMKCNAAQQM